MNTTVDVAAFNCMPLTKFGVTFEESAITDNWCLSRHNNRERGRLGHYTFAVLQKREALLDAFLVLCALLLLPCISVQ